MLCSVSLCLRAQSPATLKLTRTTSLPGVQRRIDHFAIATKGRRLVCAPLGNNTLEVLDLAMGKSFKSLTGLRKPQGVLYLAEPNQIGVANGDDGTFRLFDGGSYELLRNFGSLADADNVRYEPKTKLIYVGYGEG